MERDPATGGVIRDGSLGDSLDHDFFLFTNADTGRAAVLYRRRDGDLGLIDDAG